MAKYRLGDQPYYRDDTLYPASSVVELPDDVLPSRTWEGLDEKGCEGVEAATELYLARLRLKPGDPPVPVPAPYGFKPKAKAPPAPKAAAEPTTFSEMHGIDKKHHKRTSDREPA